MRPFLVDLFLDADEAVEDDGAVASLDVEDGVDGAPGGRAAQGEDAGLFVFCGLCFLFVFFWFFYCGWGFMSACLCLCVRCDGGKKS